MVRGSPMGILLIATGVVLLRLAYTGRFSDVWAALTETPQGAAADGTTPAASNAATGNPTDKVTGVNVETNPQQANANWSAQQVSNAIGSGIAGATTDKVFKLNQGQCPSTHWTVRAATGEQYCALKGDASIAHWNDEHKSCGAGNITGIAVDNNRGICIALPRFGAGQATDPVRLNVLPTATAGFQTRQVPNVQAGWMQ